VQVQRFKDLGDNFGNPTMRFPTRDAFQVTLRGWGVNDDSTLVIYDDSLTALGSRLYFLLELYGFDMSRVKILNGGTVGWTAFNELSKEPARRARGNVTLKPANRKLLVEWTDVYSDVVARRDPGIVLLDARPHDMYTGKLVQHSIQGGHIPGAIGIVSLDGADGQSQTWKGMDEIAALYRDIPKDKTVYAYCHDGFRSTLAWLQLKALGYKNVRVYNGGWGDWGNNLSLPVVQGDKPYDEAYELQPAWTRRAFILLSYDNRMMANFLRQPAAGPTAQTAERRDHDDHQNPVPVHRQLLPFANGRRLGQAPGPRDCRV
jgi:thiosulfate/3-mercaptopyruvate sulfurtransferase